MGLPLKVAGASDRLGPWSSPKHDWASKEASTGYEQAWLWLEIFRSRLLPKRGPSHSNPCARLLLLCFSLRVGSRGSFSLALGSWNGEELHLGAA